MRHTHSRVVILTLTLCSFPACVDVQQPTVESEPLETLPLYVWVVLAPGETIEAEGVLPQDRDNVGCRFTQSEMVERIEILQNHGCMFGPRLVLDWDGSIHEIHPTVPMRPMPELIFLAYVYNENYEPDTINIHFTPCLHSADQLGMARGYEEAVPYVAINDNGGTSPKGFTTRPPALSLPCYVPEHELTHVLGVFKGFCYPLPSGPRCYNYRVNPNDPITEHVPPGEYNILSYGCPFSSPDTVPPMPTYIPGSFDDLATERGEIWRVIVSGDWNSD